MDEPRDAVVDGAMSIDSFACELGRLHSESGNPSYAEIAARITQRRVQGGLSSERARVARSTVYDVFRPGRRRLDGALVAEILVALQLDTATVARWTAVASSAVPDDRLPPTAAQPTADPVIQPTAPEVIQPPDQPVIEPTATSASPRSHRRVALLLIGCVAVNLVGRTLATVLDLPLHLDMVGTAISAILVGPWWGALVGVLTNVLGVPVSGMSSLPFAAVNVAGALVWGYGIHRYAMGRTIPRFFTLNVLCALACSCVAAPIVYFVYGGSLGRSTDGITESVLALIHVLVVSIFLSNLLTSLADKTISGFIALAVAESRGSTLTTLATSERPPPS